MQRTLSVDATGQRAAVPTLATVEVSVKAKGDATAIAHAAVRDRATTIRDALTVVSSDQVRTVDRQVRDSTDTFEPRHAPEMDAEYQATEHLQIDCSPTTAEDLFVEVTDAGGQVETVQFELRDAVRQKLQEEALAAAMKRAHEKAERMAGAEGSAVAEVQDVTTLEASADMEGLVDEAPAATPETDLQPSPITVTERVEVVYELVNE